ncbi:hypothetical protein CLOM_g17381 [Closterium sp. NIES-68]|nr:hypothetical protein CLOM_g17381 [Closterium sp. NIES-68]GJP66643.1 hypothetical protein CLOP_g23556 [Closterium sp. NIES-67]
MERPRSTHEDLSVATPCSPGAEYHSAPELRGTPTPTAEPRARFHVFDGLEPGRSEPDWLGTNRFESGSSNSPSDGRASESDAFLSAWSPPHAGREDDTRSVTWLPPFWQWSRPQHARSSSGGGSSGWGGSGWGCSALDPSRAVCCLLDPCRAVCSPKFFWQVASVAQWCTFNVIMILVNNEIFQRYGFTFPLTLTAIHFALSFVGAFTAIEVLHVCPKAAVEAGDMMAWVVPMAVVTCFNVVLGQLSLRYVPLPALLSTKALSPGLTVAIQSLALQTEYDWQLCVSLLPVMLGAMLAYAPDVHFALPTFLSALCCVVLSCATVICAEVLLKGKQYSLDSLNALYQLVPYSALILAPPAAVLEGWQLWGWFIAQANPWPAVIAILISGCFAFCLNFSLFYTIQKTSALTFNVAGNLKLVITLVFSWLLFRTPMAPISLLGCLLELVGVGCYGWAIFSMRKRQVELLRSPSAQVRVEQEASDDIVQVYLGAML